MTVYQLHQLDFTLPQALTAADLPQLCMELFGIPNVDTLAIKRAKGRHGYRELYTIQGPNSAELIAVMLNPHSQNSRNTVHIVIHGLAWESGELDPKHICNQIVRRGGWGTNIHLAADSDSLPWEEIKAASKADTWEGRITTTTCRPRKNKNTGLMEKSPPVLLTSESETIYYGKADSDMCICLYNRRGPVRVEMRIRARAAVTDLIKRIAEGQDIGTITAGSISRNLKFHVPGASRKDNRPICGWWVDFLAGVEPLQLQRHRAPGNRSPWYVKPTRAANMKKAIDRVCTGDDTKDAEIFQELQKHLTAYEERKQLSAAWDNQAPVIAPVINLSQFPEYTFSPTWAEDIFFE